MLSVRFFLIAFVCFYFVLGFGAKSNCNTIDVSKAGLSGKPNINIISNGQLKRSWQYGETILASDEISLFTIHSKTELKNMLVKSKSNDLFVSFRVTPGMESSSQIIAYNLEIQYQRCEVVGNFVVNVQFVVGLCPAKNFDITVNCNVANSAYPYASGVMLGTTADEANVVFLGVPVGPYSSLDKAIVLSDEVSVFDLYVWCDKCDGVVYFSNPAIITDPSIVTANAILDDWLPDLYEIQRQISQRDGADAAIPVSLDWFGIPEIRDLPKPRRIRIEVSCHASGTSLLGVRLHIPYKKDITALWQKKCNVNTSKSEDTANQLITHLNEVARISALPSSIIPFSMPSLPAMFGEGPFRFNNEGISALSTKIDTNNIENTHPEEDISSTSTTGPLVGPVQVGSDPSFAAPIVVEAIVIKWNFGDFLRAFFIFGFQLIFILVLLCIMCVQCVRLAGTSKPDGFLCDLYEIAEIVNDKTVNCCLKTSEVIGSSADVASRAPKMISNPVGKVYNNNFDHDRVSDYEDSDGEHGVYFGTSGNRNGYNQI